MTNAPDKTGFALGRHLTAEFYDCDPRILADAAEVERVMLAAARKSGATVISSDFHDFKPQGVSGVVVISESHFAIHAWPEHDYAAVDLFTCGDAIDFDVALAGISSGLGCSDWIISSIMNRGIVGNNGVERLVPVIEGHEKRYALSWRKRFNSGPTPARAISAAIDVYDCSGCDLAAPGELAAFLQNFANKLGMEPVGCLRVESSDNGGMFFEIPLENGRISGFRDDGGRAVYLDIFSVGFFDPRPAAEFAVTELGGAYYRMQPHIRQ
ncbi:MAG: adenosylmethionine decarboxylase [Victivallaceae bacterium]|nr:adenosylmethionine decarboxylase [Victivallaceae bacterium]